MFIAPFVPSPNCVVEYMLKLADLKAGEVLFDMGSGDGRTVIMAAKTFGARGVGVELREDLAKKALGTIHENGLKDRD
jgi:cyclopropane fatty-acyl-phospholipid synthase-like methyltransferase